MEKVSVDKRVLIGIVALAAVSLLGLVFMLGRASALRTVSGNSLRPVPPSEPGAPRPDGLPAPVQAPVQPPVQAPVQASPRPALSPSASLTEALPGLAPRSSPAMIPLPASPSGPAAEVSSPRAVERGDSNRAAVAAYFEALDRIQPEKMAGSAEGVGLELASALANGDTSGLDGLIRDSESARTRLAALEPPQACANHHRESLASLDEALEMLRGLKTAMQSADPVAGLGAISSRAQALRARSEALQREEQSLREQYGVKR
ncbi:MAG: hypothetical protein DIJKHBIC_03153 [Thermoanaerobaculia bacterium]|nr:hypothetical protein [Thermoanaerobaculia bacterium]